MMDKVKKKEVHQREKEELKRSYSLPKLKPYLAIKALLTMMIPTEVTTLNNHAPASDAAFLSSLSAGAISPTIYLLIPAVL